MEQKYQVKSVNIQEKNLKTQSEESLSNYYYTNKAVKFFGEGVKFGGVATFMGATGYWGECDRDDPGSQLSKPARGALVGLGCATMVVSGGLGLTSTLVTVPVDLTTRMYRNVCSFFQPAKNNQATSELDLENSIPSIR